MLGKYAIFLLIFFNALALKASVLELWKQSSFENKQEIYRAYRQFYAQHTEEIADLGPGGKTWNRGLWDKLLIPSACANEGMDCIYAGWPSKLAGGFCARPSQRNPSYQAGTCSDQELHCNPLLFGPGLCAPQSTRQERIYSYSNCSKKFESEGRNIEETLRQALTDGKEEELLELFKFADNICKQGKQKNTGMCSILLKRLEALKDGLDEARAAVELANESFAMLESVGEVKSEDCGEPIDAPQEQPPAPSLASATNEPPPRAERPRSAPNRASRSNIEVADLQALRRNPGPLSMPTNERFVPSTEVVYPQNRSMNIDGTEYVVRRGPDDQVIGFSFQNDSRNAINPRTSREGSKRQWRFEFDQRSAQDAKISITEDSGLTGFMSHDLLETTMMFLPRRTIPLAETTTYEGQLAKKVTLPTGEIVYFKADTNEVIGGALSETPMDMNESRHQRKFAGVAYEGAGLMIRADKRAGTPEHIYHQSFNVNEDIANAILTHQGKTCKVPKEKIWEGARDGNTNAYFKWASDKDFLEQVVNPICGWSLSVEDLQ